MTNYVRLLTKLCKTGAKTGAQHPHSKKQNRAQKQKTYTPPENSLIRNRLSLGFAVHSILSLYGCHDTTPVSTKSQIRSVL